MFSFFLFSAIYNGEINKMTQFLKRILWNKIQVLLIKVAINQMILKILGGFESGETLPFKSATDTCNHFYFYRIWSQLMMKRIILRLTSICWIMKKKLMIEKTMSARFVANVSNIPIRFRNTSKFMRARTMNVNSVG